MSSEIDDSQKELKNKIGKRVAVLDQKRQQTVAQYLTENIK